MCLQEHLKELNRLHKSLREALIRADDEQSISQSFFALHSQLHTRQAFPTITWSYEDWLLEGLDEAKIRLVPKGQEHSIAWILWHLTRVEDVTMNLLVAGRGQVFEVGGWLEKTASPFKHTGNGTGLEMVQALSAAVDLRALRAYRVAVGIATQEIVHGLTLADFSRKVASDDLQRVLDEGAVIQGGIDVVNYWGRRNVAGLLLMPPTRHTLVHWNEAHRLKQIIKGSTFD